MLLLDVNILVQGHREDADQHEAIKEWLETVLESTADSRVFRDCAGGTRWTTERSFFSPERSGWRRMSEARRNAAAAVVLSGLAGRTTSAMHGITRDGG